MFYNANGNNVKKKTKLQTHTHTKLTRSTDATVRIKVDCINMSEFKDKIATPLGSMSTGDTC